MALIFPDSTCAICGRPFADRADLLATTAFLMPDHPLWPFSDAPLHWDCFLPWEHRADFARLYDQASERFFIGHPYWDVLYSDDDVRASLGSKFRKFRVDLKGIVTSVDIPAAEAGRWLRYPTSENVYVQAELMRVADRLVGLAPAVTAAVESC
jgi:hypothetical protein